MGTGEAATGEVDIFEVGVGMIGRLDAGFRAFDFHFQERFEKNLQMARGIMRFGVGNIWKKVSVFDTLFLRVII